MHGTTNYARIAASATLLALSISTPALAHTAPGISLSPFSEIGYGDAREYVYYRDERVSELIWDLKPAISLGLAANASWPGGFTLTAEGSFGIQRESGSMQDSDWLNVYSNGDDAKTTYSSHDAELRSSFQATIQAGWNITTPLRGIASARRVTAMPSIGLRYARWKWDSSDGSLQHTSQIGVASNGQKIYPAWNDSVAKIECRGTPITYEQTYWMPQVALALGIPVGKRLTTELSCAGSLWVSCDDIDTHYFPTSSGTTYVDYTGSASGTRYEDFLRGGYLVEPAVSFSWDTGRNATLFLGARWTKMGNLEGRTNKRSIPGGSSYTLTAENTGGAALDTLSVRLGLMTRLQ